MKKAIIYYTTNKLDGTRLNDVVQQYIKMAGLPIISVSQKPISLGKNIIYHTKGRSHTILYSQILTGLKNCDADYVFFCEHDVLYHPSHFYFTPEDDTTYFYDNNVLKYRLSDKKIIGYDCSWLSQLCASRKLLISHYKKRLKMISRGQKAYGYEPGTGQSKVIDRHPAIRYMSLYPSIDVRHGDNWTGVKRMDPSEFNNKKNCQNWKEYDIHKIQGWDTNLLLSL